MIDEAKFWKMLADYFDEEFDLSIHSEIDRFLLDDPEIRAFFHNFSKTLELSQAFETEELSVPDEIHIQLYQTLKKKIPQPKKPRARKSR
jgi:hypothetical protein